MKSSHLSDDRLIELGATGTPSSSEQQHLGACAACEAQRAANARLLEELSIAAHEDSDAVFTAERLARQQTRILQRIEQEVRPARVIAFPAASEVAPVVVRRRPQASRWIAAAAVAGLLVGLAAGRLGPETRRALGGGRQVAASAPRAVGTGATSGLRPVSATMSDDDLLGEIERAINGRGGASIRALDELTPRAWEVQ
ncbi:MAG: hypothetical protein AB7P99_09615 [Vicinamibacterales bacterium]